MLARDVFPEIGRSFVTFELFRAQHKVATTAPVVLTRTNPKHEFIGTSPIEMGWHQFPCEFEATRSAKRNMKYGLKIFAREFDPKPCLRFCSAGGMHYNYDSEFKPLTEKGIPTPHFHKVDSRGISEAYQTPPLVDPVEREKIVSNPQVGTKYFCQESNLFCPSGRAIVLDIVEDELDLSSPGRLANGVFPK